MNSQRNATCSNIAKHTSNGVYDAAMGYGWASTESAWETITSRASWSVKDAQATLHMIRLMEIAGVAELPQAAYFMRAAARVANCTLRDFAMQRNDRPQISGR